MRRFSLIIVALALGFAFAPSRTDQAAHSNTSQDRHPPTAAVAQKPEIADVAAETVAAVPGDGSRTPAQPEISISAATAKGPDEPISSKARAVAPAIAEGLTPANLPAPDEPGPVDPALAGLSGEELVAAAQTQLKRLGCYDAKVDGKWGRKSRAAVATFNERAGGQWDAAPEVELLTVLKNFPEGFCKAECAATGSDGKCVVAVQPGAQQQSLTEDDLSYLPPWMRGDKLAGIEEPDAVLPEAGSVLNDAAPLQAKPKKRAVQRPRERTAERQEKRRPRSSNDWLPEGWPGAN